MTMVGLAVLLAIAISHSQDQAKPKAATTPATSATATAPATTAASPAVIPPPSDPCSLCRGKYCPSEIQCLRLTNMQLRALNVQQALQIKSQQLAEYKQLQSEVDGMQTECKKVITDNHWPADVGCDINMAPVAFCADESKAGSCVGRAGNGNGSGK